MAPQPRQRRMGPMRLDRWTAAWLLSLGAHALLLSMPLSIPEPLTRTAAMPPLEIILLNARRTKTTEAAPQAQALAQSDSAGGGDAERGRARSSQPQHLPASAQAQTQAMTEQLGQLEKLQALMLDQIRRQMAQASQAEQRQLAEIERRISMENARPRTRYLGPSTREVVYAEYYDRLRRKIEAQGTRHFPTHLGRRLYGELTLILTVDATGRLASTEVVRGSGQSELDRRARSIANSSGPFGDFTPAMKKQADQLAWVVRFTFSAEGGLQTQSIEPSLTRARQP